jgi:hypothetical protein
MKRLIVFLVRKRLHLRKNQKFRFCNQKNDNIYYFTSDKLIKIPEDTRRISRHEKSLVSLNWLLDDGCEIEVL